ncbi:uncharacterized protein [Miscanthus floridulus]|uniref:uncharacterized protein n=1 Tax=Miscanthus floridulus TaxID=154761 RepID=UPI00345A1D82
MPVRGGDLHVVRRRAAPLHSYGPRRSRAPASVRHRRRISAGSTGRPIRLLLLLLLQVVHKNTASVLCMTTVKNEDNLQFSKILQAIKANFNDKFHEVSKNWGGGVMGSKSQAKTKVRGKAACQGSCSADEVGHALLNLSSKTVCNRSDVYGTKCCHSVSAGNVLVLNKYMNLTT